MMTWKNCKKILCVRPDNMGDLLMTAPAISALKETFNCSVSLLTSSMAQSIAPYIPGVDEIIIWDTPWVKGTGVSSPADFVNIVRLLNEKQFDGSIIFTVFSQSPLPTAFMLTLAGIPNRLAYCRENPYHLLSHWIPEKEPYTFVRHQTQRDLDLVRSIGASTADAKIKIRLPENQEAPLREKLSDAGIDATKPWLIMHPGASEKKRLYPPDQWVEAGRKIVRQLRHQVILTGIAKEKPLTDAIAQAIGREAFSIAGSLSLEAFITLIRFSPLLISVNTGSVHLAAALQTKVIVLYAMTNPQHAPWRSVGKVLPFSIPDALQSRNEVLQFVHKNYFDKTRRQVTPEDIFQAAHDLLIERRTYIIEPLVLPPQGARLTDQQHFVFP